MILDTCSPWPDTMTDSDGGEIEDGKQYEPTRKLCRMQPRPELSTSACRVLSKSLLLKCESLISTVTSSPGDEWKWTLIKRFRTSLPS
jgi:hypothetical protein